MTRQLILGAPIIFALFTLASVAAEPDTPDMNGTWKALSAELAGKKCPQKLVDSIELILNDEDYTVHVGKATDMGTVKREPGKSPKTMDITGTKGPNLGKTFLCIYEIKQDELRVCYDLSGKSRPTEFATKPDTQLFLVTYRRAKP